MFLDMPGCLGRPLGQFLPSGSGTLLACDNWYMYTGWSDEAVGSYRIPKFPNVCETVGFSSNSWILCQSSGDSLMMGSPGDFSWGKGTHIGACLGSRHSSGSGLGCCCQILPSPTDLSSSRKVTILAGVLWLPGEGQICEDSL